MKNIFSSKRIKVYSCISVNKSWNPICSFTFLSSRFIAYALSFILDKLLLEKMPLNLGLSLKYLVISILLKEWGGTKIFYSYPISPLLNALPLIPCTTEKTTGCTVEKVLTKLQEIRLLVLIFHILLFQ